MGAARDQDHPAPDEGNLLDRYPQVALGIVLLAAGNPAAAPSRNRVELERLTPAGPLLDIFDPADPDLHAEARHVVRELAAGWHADTRAAPDPACRPDLRRPAMVPGRRHRAS